MQKYIYTDIYSYNIHRQTCFYTDIYIHHICDKALYAWVESPLTNLKIRQISSNNSMNIQSTNIRNVKCVLNKEPCDLTKTIHNKPKSVITNGLYSHVGDFTYHYSKQRDTFVLIGRAGHSPARIRPKMNVFIPQFSAIS